MERSKFREKQIMGILKEQEFGTNRNYEIFSSINHPSASEIR